MKLEKSPTGWVVKIPDAIVTALGLAEGVRVTIRPVPRQADDLRHAMAETRGRLPDYPFDREDWDGVDIHPLGQFGEYPHFGWSMKPVTVPGTEQP